MTNQARESLGWGAFPVPLDFLPYGTYSVVSPLTNLYFSVVAGFFTMPTFNMK